MTLPRILAPGLVLFAATFLWQSCEGKDPPVVEMEGPHVEP